MLWRPFRETTISGTGGNCQAFAWRVTTHDAFFEPSRVVQVTFTVPESALPVTLHVNPDGASVTFAPESSAVHVTVLSEAFDGLMVAVRVVDCVFFTVTVLGSTPTELTLLGRNHPG